VAAARSSLVSVSVVQVVRLLPETDFLGQNLLSKFLGSNLNLVVPSSYGFGFPNYPAIYIAFIIIAIPHMLLITLIFYGIDIFFINILIFCSSYMKFVQCEFERLKEDLENGMNDTEEIRRRVKDIVIAHTKGIGFSEKLEEVLNLLVLYSVNTLVLCFLFFEFQIVSEPHHFNQHFNLLVFQLLSDFINLLKVLIFFGVVQTLLVLFSYFGTKLMDEASNCHSSMNLLISFIYSWQSQAVGSAAYDLPWYKIDDCKTRKYLILTILRSQRAICISSGKFHPVNLESYYEALKLAYSFCTVLKKMM
jgi:7tm Odorant receptor